LNSKLNFPNLITALRIVGTVFLLFIKPLDLWFLITYFFAGITDVLDGYIARKTNSSTELGAKLDSIADLLFYAVMLTKIFPILFQRLPKEIWGFLAIILLIRAISYLTAAIKFHVFSSLHTVMNKVTGLAVFTIPFYLLTDFEVPLSWGVCVIAVIASLEELFIHILSKEYDESTNSIITVLKN